MGFFRGEGGLGPETSGSRKLVRRTAETLAILAALGLGSEAKAQANNDAVTPTRVEAGGNKLLQDERDLIALSDVAGRDVYQGDYKWKRLGVAEENSGYRTGGSAAYVGKNADGRVILCYGDYRTLDCDVSGEEGHPSGAFALRISVRGDLPAVPEVSEEGEEHINQIRFLKLVEAETPEQLETLLRDSQEYRGALVEVGRIDPEEGVEVVTTSRDGAVTTVKNPVDLARVQRNRNNVSSRLVAMLDAVRVALGK